MMDDDNIDARTDAGDRFAEAPHLRLGLPAPVLHRGPRLSLPLQLRAQGLNARLQLALAPARARQPPLEVAALWPRPSRLSLSGQEQTLPR
jgi:hypothetical protein